MLESNEVEELIAVADAEDGNENGKNVGDMELPVFDVLLNELLFD
jgi:hypothetical protein